MNQDLRCCGSGTCIIDLEGRCWCGRQWANPTKGQAPAAVEPAVAEEAAVQPTRSPPSRVHDLYGSQLW